MNVYFDTEFTGLHQYTTLISIGCVSEDGKQFYAQLSDYDEDQVNDWIRENVLAHLWYGDHSAGQVPDFIGTHEQIARCLAEWLSQWPQVVMFSDCLAYDWVLFCELFGGALNIPQNVYYIPVDLATALLMHNVDPDINREEFASMSDGATKHNAAWDAKVIRQCFLKLRN